MIQEQEINQHGCIGYASWVLLPIRTPERCPRNWQVTSVKLEPQRNKSHENFAFLQSMLCKWANKQLVTLWNIVKPVMSVNVCQIPGLQCSHCSVWCVLWQRVFPLLTTPSFPFPRHFIGTSVSTFSFRIHEEREILGFDPKTTYNRFCGDAEKVCEQPTHWKIVYWAGKPRPRRHTEPDRQPQAENGVRRIQNYWDAS